MKNIGRGWAPILLSLLVVAIPAVAAEPESDIVAVVSAEPLDASDNLPGLINGQSITDRLRDALEMVRAGVPNAARPDLTALLSQLRSLLEGNSLPSGYRQGSELWLPIRARRLQVRLDAPDLRPRPEPGGTGGQPGNLPATAQRIDWLPVRRTAQRVDQALPLLSAGHPGLLRAQRLLQAALGQTQSSLVLERRPLILAYYAVEHALSAVPHWSDTTRQQLRHMAMQLTKMPGNSDLVNQIQTQADRLTPDLASLEALAAALRKQIVDPEGEHEKGDSTTGQTAGPSADTGGVEKEAEPAAQGQN